MIADKKTYAKPYLRLLFAAAYLAYRYVRVTYPLVPSSLLLGPIQ